MKSSLITAGGHYYDGKMGIRSVVSIDAQGNVRYKILASKVENDFDSKTQSMVSILGHESGCTLPSFASWAVVQVSDESLPALLADLAAKRLKLPADEKALMVSLASELATADSVSDSTPNSTISFDPSELRPARGLEKKGLLHVLAGADRTGGDLQLTELGYAWVRLQTASE